MVRREREKGGEEDLKKRGRERRRKGGWKRKLGKQNKEAGNEYRKVAKEQDRHRGRKSGGEKGGR